jgi:hypothetical protein
VYKRQLGTFEIPVVQLQPPLQSAATRGLNVNHVKTLKAGIVQAVSGHQLRSTLKVSLVGNEHSGLSPRVTNSKIKYLLETSADLRSDKLLDLLNKNILRATTIGGNHSRQAFLELIKEGHPDFPHTFTLRCDVYAELSENEETAI